MDLIISKMSSGERATLSNILTRGLASLTAGQRTPHTVASVDRLQQVLRETPYLDNHSASALGMLAFRPRGLGLLGVDPMVRAHLHTEGLIAQGGPQEPWISGRWVITPAGWQQLWDSGWAAAQLSLMFPKADA